MFRIIDVIKLTAIYTINTSFVTFLSIIYFISGFQEIAIEISILQSCIIFFTLSISSYSRNLIILDKNMYKIFNNFHLRFIIATIINVLSFFILFFFKTENFFILYIISTILVLQWIFELIIAKVEIRKDKTFLNYNSLFLLTIFIFFFIFYILEIYRYYFYLILIFCGYILIYVIKDSLIIIFLKNNVYDKFLLLFKDYSIVSSSFITLANLFWKILIVFFYGKIFSASLFFIFTLCSFISTLYNNSLGYTLLKKNINLNLLLIIIYILLTIIIIFNYDFILNFIPKSINVIQDNQFFFKNTIIYSFIGSILMLIGQFLRSLSLNNFPNKRNFTYKIDIVYSFILIAYCLMITILGNIDHLKWLFLLSGITNCIIYLISNIYVNNYIKI